MITKRRVIECSLCLKNKPHAAKGMCDPCWRKTKRKTEPTFYLRTCYSEMLRRVRTFDKLRPNYKGMTICSISEFINRFQTDANFLSQFQIWKESEFQRKFSPSIDRIDNEKGYSVDNLQFLQHNINSVKDKLLACQVVVGDKIHYFDSQNAVAEFLNLSPALICKVVKYKNGLYKNFKITRLV